MRNEIKVLMGATENGELVIANIRLGVEGVSRDYFAVSFDSIYPVEVTDEYLRERVESLMDDVDSDWKVQLLEDFDCRPSELVDEYMNRELSCNGVEGILDISLYPESFSIDGYDDIYFESSSCGQNDTREELIPINSEFSTWLHSMWDSNHLEAISEEVKEACKVIINDYEEQVGDMEEWIQEWLENSFNK